ncbi:sugar transferase [Lapillicoccus jejuensis]|uniref:Undecaprenyl-phosphate galactose phosphotransferase WbaP/exopolysaccharide biosynthesis polyprenyl glycosylphosphotransferase n=1 Tax=Lapillicoccus jejuensis TaxID=402171 RepID=A0A542E1G6_9MICO|nr:sugar transferase [Lapillicoccus jejuensis]TQJ09177.1 Undecaprenyl-phosphate galactose phosphotransferase WbaP/exopolysaccharide biosynthesis polyprenyl glycosylphosphotransferase [Lapillicoccus jejuensis]
MTEYVGTYHQGVPVDDELTVTREASPGRARPWGERRRPRKWVSGYRTRVLAADLVSAAVVAAVVALATPSQGSLGRILVLGVTPLVWVLALGLVQTYSEAHIGAGTAEYRAVGQAGLLVASTVGLLFFVTDVRVPRAVLVPLVPATVLASIVVHWALRRDLLARRERGACLHDTVVVGRADSVEALIREIVSAPEAGMRIVAACVSGLDDPAHREMTEIEGVPVFGPPESALAAVDAYGAEVVAVSSHPDLVGAPLRRLGWALAERQVDLVVAPGIVEVAGPRLSLRPAAGVSLLHVERPLDSGARVVAKRVADALMTAGILVVALPVMAVIALLVKLTSAGPVFYLQERVGTRGERFRMVKFRTMVVNADALVSSMAGGHDVNAVLFKQRDDPRITSVGKILRKYSLDELPQLFNVLAGQMSLVGPRPPLPREVDAYEPDAVQRLRVRPGMTGLWQISGRSDLSWEQSLRLDLWYVDNWSLVLDLQILVRTVKAVIRHTGAY